MWYSAEKYIKGDLVDVNAELEQIAGEMEDKEAKIALARFLRANIGFTVELISGIKLAPYQEIILKAMLQRNFSMNVWGRGCAKTFVASVFCFLQCIFEPNSKILIAGPTFRTARFIFSNLEKMVSSPGAQLLQQAFSTKPSKRGDQFEWLVNGGSITAIPLNGEKIRGFRANILVLDEYLLLPEEIIKNVLMPFLVAPQDMTERLRIREAEDAAIKDGLMGEADRQIFENNSKMIALSSASFTFENLYKTYLEWTEQIMRKENGDATYFISQFGYEALPPDMIDKTIIEEAQAGGQSNSSFQREYCAQFTDGSDSYFSAKKMHECTVPDGQEPTLRLTGIPDGKYLISIDPSFSNAPNSDDFAMSVFEMGEEEKDAVLVHNYAVAGADLKEHIQYFKYLMDSFKPEMIIIDNAGFQFIDSCNESDYFRSQQYPMTFFDFDSDLEGVDYELMVKQARNQYNKEKNCICFKQNFSSDFIRKGNEHLQACIDYKKIWFGSRISPNGAAFDRATNSTLRIPLKPEETIIDAIDTQDDRIYQVKKQCALIEVKSTVKGTQSFDLPQHLKRNTSANRARKDSYTALMLGNWLFRCYKDIKTAPIEQVGTFTPFFV
jgi:hypothetical protein